MSDPITTTMSYTNYSEEIKCMLKYSHGVLPGCVRDGNIDMVDKLVYIYDTPLYKGVLMDAIQPGNLPMVEYLTHITPPDTWAEFTKLDEQCGKEAIRINDLDIVKYIIQLTNMPVDLCDIIRAGHVDMFKYMLDTYNQFAEYETEYILTAIRFDRLDIIKIMIEVIDIDIDLFHNPEVYEIYREKSRYSEYADTLIYLMVNKMVDIERARMVKENIMYSPELQEFYNSIGRGKIPVETIDDCYIMRLTEQKDGTPGVLDYNNTEYVKMLVSKIDTRFIDLAKVFIDTCSDKSKGCSELLLSIQPDKCSLLLYEVMKSGKFAPSKLLLDRCPPDARLFIPDGCRPATNPPTEKYSNGYASRKGFPVKAREVSLTSLEDGSLFSADSRTKTCIVNLPL